MSRPSGKMAAEALVAAAQAGDRRALEHLLAREQPRLYAYSKSLCGNAVDAEDVLQETMLAVVRGIGGFRGGASVSTWLFQIARSFCIKRRRRRKGEPARFETSDPEILLDTAPSPESRMDGRELARLLEAALRALPAASREIIVLRDVEGLSAAEVAELLGTSVGAVKSKLHRARAALARSLRPHLGVGAAAPARGRECPNILSLYSKKLEGELSGALCADLEGHVGACGRCRSSCRALKQTLALCRRTPVVPREVQERVRASVRRVMEEANGAASQPRRRSSSA